MIIMIFFTPCTDTLISFANISFSEENIKITIFTANSISAKYRGNNQNYVSYI